MSNAKHYNFRNLRVLTVDDSRFMTRVVQQVLKTLGIGDIAMAHSGYEAWDLLSDFQPDLVISDWDMDDGQGPELVQRIRMDPSSPCPYVSVIMLTGYAERRRVLAARDFGITEFLTKPVSAKALYARLVAMVENPRPFIRVGESYFGPDRRRGSALGQSYKGTERRSDDFAMI